MALDSFSGSYGESRSKFLAAAGSVGARLHSYERDDLLGAEGERLVCDVAVLGPGRAKRAAIAITGTHGSEAFGCTALLHRWLTTRREAAAFDGVKVVLVHSINPWAFSHRTRATERNVDLNRNFLEDGASFHRTNPAHDALAPFFYIDAFDAKRCLDAYRDYCRYLDEHGWHLENEQFEGQTQRPDGFCYAGIAPEWSNRTFRRIINEHLGDADTIGFVDWHTGVGSFGEIVHLIFDAPGSPEYSAAAAWWGCGELGQSAFQAGVMPKYRGLLCQAIRQERPSARIAGGVVEFGTADAFSLFRADRLDRWLRFEGHDDPDRALYLADYENTFNPRDLSWKRLVLREGPRIMDELISGVGSWRD